MEEDEYAEAPCYGSMYFYEEKEEGEAMMQVTTARNNEYLLYDDGWYQAFGTGEKWPRYEKVDIPVTVDTTKLNKAKAAILRVEVVKYDERNR